MRLIAVVFFSIVIGVASTALESVPNLINYQGRLTDSIGQPINGSVSLTFAVYGDSVGGLPLWSEVHSAVVLDRGLFDVQLGANSQLPTSLFDDTLLYLGIRANSDPEFAPRTRLISTPYAFRVRTVDGSTGGHVTGDLVVSGRGTFGEQSVAMGVNSFASGESDSASGDRSSVLGGFRNVAEGDNSVIGGGAKNRTLQSSTTVCGGEFNTADGGKSAIVGGRANTANGIASMVGGGVANRAQGNFSVVCGGGGPEFSGADSNVASGDYSFIGAGKKNISAGASSTIVGGDSNFVDGIRASIGGGFSNTVTGLINVTNGNQSTIAGGAYNTIVGPNSCIGGGAQNSIDQGTFGTIAGGHFNRIFGIGATVGGGEQDSALGSWATVPGGGGCSAHGDYSFAAGRSAKALHHGSFVWADGTNNSFASDADETFNVRATGGVRFVTATNGSGAPTAGVYLGAGGGSWGSLSDRNAKKNLSLVNGDSILAKVEALPVYEWSYNSQPDSVRHIGPMAQDFQKAFKVGEDERHITTVDAEGVALVAAKQLALENRRLKERVDRLEKLVEQLARGEKR